MKEYVVYSTNPNLLEKVGEVYYPKLRMSFVLLKTDLELHNVRRIEGVYEVREARDGEFFSLKAETSGGRSNNESDQISE